MKRSRNELYRSQQAKLATLRRTRSDIAPYRIATASVVTMDNEPLSHSVLDDFIAEQQATMAAMHAPVTVSTQETSALLSQLSARWDGERMHLLLEDCRSSVLKSIAGPFGLGYVVAAADKVGGNVDTIHNVRNKDENGNAAPIFATEQARQRYEARGAYDKQMAGAYHKHEAYIAAGKANKAALERGELSNCYTGELFTQSDRQNKQTRPTVDHKVSCKEIHNDAGRVLAGIDGIELSNRKSNLGPTSQTINSVLGDKPAVKALQDIEAKRVQRQVNIAALEAKTELSDQERKRLVKFREIEAIDHKRVLAADKKARAAIDEEVNQTYYSSEEFRANVLQTGSDEAGKMGLQQSVGLLLVEFLTASFDEIIDVYQHGMRADMQGATFFNALRIRLNRIAKRVTARWKDAMVAFKDGAFSGFLSNLVTMMVNTLVTTSKRVVRVIREGLMSILSALKIALFPPKGMTRAQAGDAALKLLATGLTTSLGVMAEDVCEKAVMAFFTANVPLLAPIAAPVAAVLVATMTGIASALLVYSLDRLDIFGVRQQREHEMVLRELDQAIEDGDRRINERYKTVMEEFHLQLF